MGICKLCAFFFTVLVNNIEENIFEEVEIIKKTCLNSNSDSVNIHGPRHHRLDGSAFQIKIIHSTP